MFGQAKYFIISLGLLSLVIPTRGFATEERKVFSFPKFYNLNPSVHLDVEGMFNM